MGRAARLRPGFLDRLLSPFTVLQPGEGKNAVLLTLGVFLLLTSYYVLKVVREPLILSAGGAELKSYTSAAQAVLLLFLIPAYGAIANRVSRIRLISIVTLFFISNLAIFFAMAVANTPYLGVAYFIWVGIFNLMIIAQFWSFANESTPGRHGCRHHRLRADAGCDLGALLSSAHRPLHVHDLMLVAAPCSSRISCLFASCTVAPSMARAQPQPSPTNPCTIAGEDSRSSRAIATSC
jgi:AAA family ATP:ADP antiporter